MEEEIITKIKMKSNLMTSEELQKQFDEFEKHARVNKNKPKNPLIYDGNLNEDDMCITIMRAMQNTTVSDTPELVFPMGMEQSELRINRMTGEEDKPYFKTSVSDTEKKTLQLLRKREISDQLVATTIESEIPYAIEVTSTMLEPYSELTEEEARARCYTPPGDGCVII